MSAYFKPVEYECRCGCGFSRMSEITLNAADHIREYLDRPVTVNSGCRCVDHNKKIGGASASWHLPRKNGDWMGRAMDLDIHGPDQDKAVELIEKAHPNISYIRYHPFLHIDSRPNRYVGDMR